MSHRTRALCIATVAIVAVLLPNAAWAQTRLNATVGPGFTISLRDATGANVTHLPVGTYEIAVNDQAIEHNLLQSMGLPKSGAGQPAPNSEQKRERS